MQIIFCDFAKSFAVFDLFVGRLAGKPPFRSFVRLKSGPLLSQRAAV